MRRVMSTAFVLALVAAGVALLTRVLIVPRVESVSGWVIPADAWTPLRAARSVANLDVFHLYEPLAGRTGYPYTPGLPILLAAVPWIGDRFHLLGDPIYPHPRPAMFLLLGPSEAFVGMLPLLWAAGRAVHERVNVVRFEWWLFFAAAWAPVVWFHPEDTIVVALCIGACMRVRDDDWRRVGAYIAVAILFKQWAIFPAVPIIMAAPRGRRAIASFYALALPVIIMIPFFLASPSTWSSLSGTLATLKYGQPQLWLSTLFNHHQYANATALRVLWGAISVALAWRVRARPEPDRVLAAVGLVMLARLLFEPVLFGYYVVPAAAIALVWCARNGRPYVLRAITAGLVCAFCLPKTFPQPVFFAIFWAALAYVCAPMATAVFERLGSLTSSTSRVAASTSATLMSVTNDAQ